MLSMEGVISLTIDLFLEITKVSKVSVISRKRLQHKLLVKLVFLCICHFSPQIISCIIVYDCPLFLFSNLTVSPSEDHAEQGDQVEIVLPLLLKFIR